MSKDFVTKQVTIALVLMLTMASAFMTFGVVNAQFGPPTPTYIPSTVKTYGFISAAPNPVGLGQTIFINFWVHMPAPTVDYLRGIDVWKNLTVTVTAPDHHQTVLGPFKADATGGTYTTFVPDQLGNYSFTFNFHGQTLTGPVGFGTDPKWIGVYFQPCSATATLTVQQEKVEQYPTYPPTTDYWERPIYSMNTEWYKIGGNWLGLASSTFHTTGLYNASGNFAPYTTAPKSAHIIWTRPMKLGGQLGGEFGGTQLTQFVSTSQYQPFYGPIVIAGRLYWQERPGSSQNPTGWNCVNIKTGELIWHKNITDSLMFGQILDYESINQYGAYGYLWASRPTVAPNVGATYGMYDAWTGNWICDIVNATLLGSSVTPGLTWMLDMRTCKGSLLGYFVDSSIPGTRNLVLWNSTWCILAGSPGPFGGAGPSGDPHGQWWGVPIGAKIDFKWGKVWSKPIPTNYTGTYASGKNISLSIVGSQSTPDVILTRYSSAGAPQQPGWFIDAGFSARDGSKLWGPFNRTDVVKPFTYTRSGPAGSGCYAYGCSEEFTWTGFSLTTGQKLWGPKEFPYSIWDKYGIHSQTAYGNLYTIGFGGVVNCIDYDTGDLKWTYRTGGSGYDTPYGVWTLWTFTRTAIADGKIYCGEGHEYSPPLFRGAQELCIDAFTGKLVWSVLGFFAEGPPTIADGVMVNDNAYDMQLYAFSKGQTATTVTAPLTAVANGSIALIQGTVTDQSPGAKGTPAIGDLYMKPWMEYLYMQQPMPQNATGVPVQLQAVGPDGALINIATVTSDAFGKFEYLWTPPTTGTYKILASFGGSDSYYASYAETALGVGPAPAAPPPVEIPAYPDYTSIFLGLAAIGIVAIIIGLVNLFWKRK